MACKWRTLLRSFAVAVASLSVVSSSAFAALEYRYRGIASNVFFRCDGVVPGAFFLAGASFSGSAGGVHLGYDPQPPYDHAYAYEATSGALRPDGVVPIEGHWGTSVFLYIAHVGPAEIPVYAVVNPATSLLEGSLSSRAGGVLFLHGNGQMQHLPLKDLPKCTVDWTFEGQIRSDQPPQPPSGLWVTTQGVDVKARGPAGRGALWRAVTPCAIGTTCFAPQGSTSPDLLVRLLPLGGGRVGPAWMPLSASSFDVWSRGHGGDEPRAWLIPTAPAITSRPGLLDLIGHGAAAPSTAGAAIDDEREIIGAANPPPPSATWQTTPALTGFRFQALLAGKPLVKTRSCPAKAICLAARPLAAPDVVVRVTAKQANGKRWASLGKFATSTAAVWIEQTSTHAVRYYELQQRAADSPLLPGLLDRLAFAP